jgi:hypothetical protein
MAAVSSGAVILEDDGSRVTLQYVCVSCGRAQPGTKIHLSRVQTLPVK